MGVRRGRSPRSLAEARPLWRQNLQRYVSTQKERRSVPGEEWRVIADEACEALEDLQTAMLRERGRGFGPEDISFVPAGAFGQDHAVEFFGVSMGVFRESFREESNLPRDKIYAFFHGATDRNHTNHVAGNFLVFDGDGDAELPGHVLLERPAHENFSKREKSLARRGCKGEILRRIQRRLTLGPAPLYDYKPMPGTIR